MAHLILEGDLGWSSVSVLQGDRTSFVICERGNEKTEIVMNSKGVTGEH